MTGLKTFKDGVQFKNTIPLYTPTTLDYYEEYVILTPPTIPATFSLTSFSTETDYTLLAGQKQIKITSLSVEGVAILPAVSSAIPGCRLIRVGKMVTLIIPPFNIISNYDNSNVNNQGMNLIPRNSIPDRFLPRYDTRFYCDFLNNNTVGTSIVPGSSAGANIGFSSNWVSAGQENSEIIVRANDVRTRWPTIAGTNYPLIPALPPVPLFGDVFVRIVHPTTWFAQDLGSYESISVTWITG